jgi:hypothetical protein
MSDATQTVTERDDGAGGRAEPLVSAMGNLPMDDLFPLRRVSCREVRMLELIGPRERRAWWVSGVGEHLYCGALMHAAWAAKRLGLPDQAEAEKRMIASGAIPIAEPLSDCWALEIGMHENASDAAIATARKVVREHFECNPDFPVLISYHECHSWAEASPRLRR